MKTEKEIKEKLVICKGRQIIDTEKTKPYSNQRAKQQAFMQGWINALRWILE